MFSVDIRKTSITELDTDAIVNAANEGLWAGGGVCGAIFQAAGYNQLEAACRKIGHCDTGSSVITPGFRLKAKYVIHAVGPRWTDGRHGELEKLYSAYYHSLELALDNGCNSIGFPLISSGIFGCPPEESWKAAFKACSDFFKQHLHDSPDVVFAVLNDSAKATGRKILLGSPAARYRVAQRGDWRTEPMPEQHGNITLQRSFTDQEMACLRRGHIPQAMEDKWFWYMEGDTLFVHRSWTGCCIYRIDFKPDNNHYATVNLAPERFRVSGIEEGAKKLNSWLDWWTLPGHIEDPFL